MKHFVWLIFRLQICVKNGEQQILPVLPCRLPVKVTSRLQSFVRNAEQRFFTKLFGRQSVKITSSLQIYGMEINGF